MRSALARLAIGIALAAPVTAQTLDKELVATLSGPAIEGGVVSELLWDGGIVIIRSAALQANGELAPRYFAAPGPRKQGGAWWDISVVRVPERFRN